MAHILGPNARLIAKHFQRIELRMGAMDLPGESEDSSHAAPFPTPNGTPAARMHASDSPRYIWVASLLRCSIRLRIR